jgi:phosphoglycolate phosphatase
MNKLVVFDLDGTLIDSVPDIAECTNVTLKKFNHAPVTEKEVTQMIGNGARNLIKAAVKCQLNDAELDERLKFYIEIYTACNNAKTKLFDGVKETLVELKARGYQLAILTNKPQGATDKVCQTYMGDIEFYKVMGAGPTVKIKPDPTELEKMLQELSVLPENAYFVGDGDADVLVAKNAGVNGIAALYGYRTKEQLLSVGAKTFINNFKDLLDILK